MYVTPTPETIAAGLRVADPAHLGAAAESARYIPPEGRDVGTAHLDYWIRRQRDGDVTITAAAPASVPESDQAAPTASSSAKASSRAAKASSSDQAADASS